MNGNELLSSILKTTQMGQLGIRSILSAPMNPALKKVLRSQLAEYASIECQAHQIASARGWCVEQIDPVMKKMTDMMTRIRLSGNRSNSRIAEMMIQGNYRGKIKSIKNRHRFSGNDPQLSELSQKLLDHEAANIHQMEQFL